MGFAIQLVTSDNNGNRLFSEANYVFVGMAESGKKQIKGWIKSRVVKKLSGSR